MTNGSVRFCGESREHSDATANLTDWRTSSHAKQYSMAQENGAKLLLTKAVMAR
jgi:hypothetical protein